MKNLHLITWLTQLGLSVAVPLGGFIFLGVWLRQRFDLGIWVVIAGVVLGIYCAVDGFRQSLKTLQKLSKEEKKEEPSCSFNDHD